MLCLNRMKLVAMSALVKILAIQTVHKAVEIVRIAPVEKAAAVVAHPVRAVAVIVPKTENKVS